jgi:hypothetical protein
MVPSPTGVTLEGAAAAAAAAAAMPNNSSGSLIDLWRRTTKLVTPKEHPEETHGAVRPVSRRGRQSVGPVTR